MPRVEPASPLAIVPSLLRHLAERGRDAGELAARLGLPPDAAARDDVAVTPSQLAELLDAAAGLLGEPALALRLPELPHRRYGVLELAMRAAATVRDALHQATRYATLVHPAIEHALVEHGAEARWHLRTPHHPRGLGRHVHEYALAVIIAQLRAALSAPLPLARVWFAHPRPPALAPIARWAGTDELAFGCADSGFALPRALLDTPLATADPRLAATVETLAGTAIPAAPSTAIAPRVATLVRERLPAELSAADAATALHMSARTLQRRLDAEGTRFSDVVDATREALARELLGDLALPLGEIAYRVGFSDLATFSRAFKRWTGMPPGLFRRS
ncbi:MAG TPA: AraC family transcriptional regulator ligand-binding domain-containing protein [Kofleriaceae bacterium]|nr:AraC family transcriptional regulator ligand-binding domain-containing protein [Kofleriaceae bacterium]